MVLIDKNYHSDAGVLVDFGDDLKKENFMRSLFCDVVKFFAGHKKGSGILEKNPMVITTPTFSGKEGKSCDSPQRLLWTSSTSKSPLTSLTSLIMTSLANCAFFQFLITTRI